MWRAEGVSSDVSWSQFWWNNLIADVVFYYRRGEKLFNFHYKLEERHTYSAYIASHKNDQTVAPQQVSNDYVDKSNNL